MFVIFLLGFAASCFAAPPLRANMRMVNTYMDLELIIMNIVDLIKEEPIYGEYLKSIRNCSLDFGKELEGRIKKCLEDGKEFKEDFEDYNHAISVSVQKVDDAVALFTLSNFPKEPWLGPQTFSYFYSIFIEGNVTRLSKKEIQNLLQDEFIIWSQMMGKKLMIDE